jgi:hypothetical protein
MSKPQCWHCYAPVPPERICCDDRSHWLCAICYRHFIYDGRICPDCNGHLMDRNPDHGVD